MRRTSSSISRAVSLEIGFGCVAADMPKNTSPSSSSYNSGPMRSEKPQRVTMLRANCVARSMSLAAPVVMPCSPLTICSATRPPNNVQIWLWMERRLKLWRSSSGRNIVTPNARPRGTMVIL